MAVYLLRRVKYCYPAAVYAQLSKFILYCLLFAHKCYGYILIGCRGPYRALHRRAGAIIPAHNV